LVVRVVVPVVVEQLTESIIQRELLVPTIRVSAEGTLRIRDTRRTRPVAVVARAVSEARSSPKIFQVMGELVSPHQ
jgi:hypothetical protein